MKPLKIFFNKIIIAGMLLLVGFATSCDDRDDIIDPQYDRLFSPVNLEYRLVNQVNVRLTWDAVKNAESYTIELFTDRTFEGTPARTINGVTDITYTVEGLDGDTDYFLRIQAESSSISESKWTDITFKTGSEQIFKTVAAEDLGATEVTLRWTAGAAATSIVVNPDNITYTVTADDIAAGAATVPGLTGETAYTAVLYNNEKVRGTITFTTTVDIGTATLVKEGDNLATMLAAATEGEVFAIMPGTYSLGEYSLTKSIALKGVRPADRPIITGHFKIETTVSSIGLNAIILDGNNASRPFDGDNANCNISSITISDCVIRNYKSGFVYTNKTASFGSISITNSIVKNITGDGGDGFDFRAGTLGSLTVTNTTFDTGFRTFVRIQVSSNVAFRNCTFYKISSFNDTNNHGLFRMSGGGTFEVSKCLFVETGATGTLAATTVGNFCRQSGNMAATPTYSSNYIYSCNNLLFGLYTTLTEISATEANPGFKDAANSDFTLSNEDMIYNQIGDSRWR